MKYNGFAFCRIMSLVAKQFIQQTYDSLSSNINDVSENRKCDFSWKTYYGFHSNNSLEKNTKHQFQHIADFV